MTDKELIARALEFLEDNQHHIADHERHAYVMLYNNFITALKERLADPMREVQRLGQEIEQEQNFCSRCGKRTNDIHTCTPPKENT